MKAPEVKDIVDGIAAFHEWIESSKANSDSWKTVGSKESIYPDAEKSENRFTAELLENLRSHTHHFTGSSPNDYEQQHAAVAIHKLLIQGLAKDSIYLTQDPNEIGFVVENDLCGEIVINDDTNSYQERLRELTLSGVLDTVNEQSVVVEIGGGYGGLASAIKKAKPNCRYAIIDLPESLKFSYSFLSLLGYKCLFATQASFDAALFSGYDFVLIPTDNKHILPKESVDLAINTLSFTEMPKSIVEDYGTHLKQWLKPSGILFEQNNEYPEHCGVEFIHSTTDVFPHYFSYQLELNRFSVLGVSRVWGMMPVARRFTGLLLTKPKNHENCIFALFGAGKTGVMLQKQLGQQLEFSHFYDNDPNKWQTEICELVVHSPEQIKTDIETAKSHGKHLVIVLSSYFYHQIFAQLREALSTSDLAKHVIFINQLESYFERGVL